MNISEGYRPHSIAIAGAWGYIGRKLLDAAWDLGINIYVHDPGRVPADVPSDRVTRIDDARAFYALPAPLFHLALHPEHRQLGMQTLLRRTQAKSPLILNEKPMATPDRPADCPDIIRATAAAGVAVLYDFPELFDDMTRRILAFLQRFDRVRIAHMAFCRSKDREAKANPRNDKRMVPIQYQESVHCLAFAIYLLSHVAGDMPSVFHEGLRANAVASSYQPPNPEIYPYVVDGRCEYSLNVAGVSITGLTDFTAGAAWSKRRVIQGHADGQPFTIEADYLENHKWLTINGVAQPCDATASSYVQIILNAWRWFQDVPVDRLMTGLYPNPRFAHVTYQLSSLLWRSAYDRDTITLDSMADLLAFDAGFAGLVDSFPHYA